jgi:predicted nucleic acid-binding protein
LIVLDASLMVEWLIRTDRRSIFPEIYEAVVSVPILVPCHWPLEIGNALSPDVRSGVLSVADFYAIMDDFDQVDIRLQPPIGLDEIGPLAKFAVSHSLTVYDAVYVQLALQHTALLATLDHAMRRAATMLEIPLLPVEQP